MSIQRLNRVPVVILTGVENAGKTTLSEGLAAALQWDLIPEAARTDKRVLEGNADQTHLQQMLEQFNHSLVKLLSTAEKGILCDTGGLVLDMWSQHAFGKGLEGAEFAMKQAQLHLLCQTLPRWEPDPLRNMPVYADRVNLEGAYRKRLIRMELPFSELPPEEPSGRLQQALDFIHKLCPL